MTTEGNPLKGPRNKVEIHVQLSYCTPGQYPYQGSTKTIGINESPSFLRKFKRITLVFTRLHSRDNTNPINIC